MDGWRVGARHNKVNLARTELKREARRMASTVDELAADLCVDPGDVLTLARMYPEDEAETWEEEGVLSDRAAADIRLQLNGQCERTLPELYP